MGQKVSSLKERTATEELFVAKSPQMKFFERKRRYRMDNIKLLHGDCLELMKDIPAASIDLILCDLPYGTTRNKWDSVIPLELLWEEYRRVIKSNGAIVLFSQQPFTSELVTSNKSMFKYEWVWQKSQGTGHLNAKKMPLKAHENILVFYDKLPTYNPQWWYGKKYKASSGKPSSNYGAQNIGTVTISDGRRYPLDCLQVARTEKDKYLHPTQKPVALLEYFIKTYTNEGEMVLDNCMGSGSTGVACVNTNRAFIGIELNEEYFTIAETRINDALKGETICCR